MLHKVIDKVDVFYFICALMIQCTWASSSEITILIPVSMHKLLQQFNVIPMLRQHQLSVSKLPSCLTLINMHRIHT